MNRAIIIFLLSFILTFKIFGQKADSDRKSEVVTLKIGHKVPDEFWTHEHLFYVNGDTVRRNLQEYKGRLLILDFWMIGCSKCFLHQKEINHYKELYKDELAVVMVNGVKTKNNYASIHSYLNNKWFLSLGLESFSSIIESTYLEEMFQPDGYPMYYWINHFGILQTITFRNILDRNYVAPFLDN
ncbi:TlpA family protein disulfide reductase [Sphingobacterium faecale]|uniref:Redoxin domain-containing protein n=1 Tax=Sphingobacterium faecale TaxID=2803775 RepID=A0ABS1RAA2_9SPHI|nr:hypothetical protein [Sphingobacterium faecale]MBL1411479.1 hypothetical protein [Sphingobacterium faecale]